MKEATFLYVIKVHLTLVFLQIFINTVQFGPERRAKCQFKQDKLNSYCEKLEQLRSDNFMLKK